MMKRREVESLLGHLNERFGFPENIFQDYAFFLSKKQSTPTTKHNHAQKHANVQHHIYSKLNQKEFLEQYKYSMKV